MDVLASIPKIFVGEPFKLKLAFASVWAFILSAIEFLLRPVGGWEFLTNTTVIFVIGLFLCDWITGIIKAILPKKEVCDDCERSCGRLSSWIAMRGAVKGGMYAILVYIGIGLTRLSDNELIGMIVSVAGGLIIGLVCITEILSVLENLACISVLTNTHIPFIKNLIEYFKMKEKELLNRTKPQGDDNPKGESNGRPKKNLDRRGTRRD